MLQSIHAGQGLLGAARAGDLPQVLSHLTGLLQSEEEKKKKSASVRRTPAAGGAEFRKGETDVDHVSATVGITALQFAAQGGHREIVRALLEAGAKHTHGWAEDGSSPLIAAAGGGHSEVVQALLAAGADPNMDVVERLVEANGGRDPETADPGSTALMGAIQGGHARVVQQLLVRVLNLITMDGSPTTATLH